MSEQKKTSWFEVDRVGLRKVLARRPKSAVIAELLQNALDEVGVTQVAITVTKLPGSRLSEITVEDDAPNGFQDLAHAYTMFAESKKKSDPSARGRFNVGEKLAIAISQEATVHSTTGGWRFDDAGRHRINKRRDRGSQVSLKLQLSETERLECDHFIALVLPPAGITVSYNGQPVAYRKPAYSTSETLPTEIADADGNLRPTKRKTLVELVRPAAGELAWVYELGIPVCPTESGSIWSINVHQKVPLNLDRDSVNPSYLAKLHTIALNLTHRELTTEQANAPWVREGMASKSAAPEAVKSAFNTRFGDKTVIYDPSDPEANKRAVAGGYTVVHSGHLTAAEWERVRDERVALPAGQVTPSPKPFSPDGAPLELINPADYTDLQRAAVSLIARIASAVIGRSVQVVLTPDRSWGFNAAINPDSGHITLNVAKVELGQTGDIAPEKLVSTVIHELSHTLPGAEDHLSDEFHRATCLLGARLAVSCTMNNELLVL